MIHLHTAVSTRCSCHCISMHTDATCGMGSGPRLLFSVGDDAHESCVHCLWHLAQPVVSARIGVSIGDSSVVLGALNRRIVRLRRAQVPCLAIRRALLGEEQTLAMVHRRRSYVQAASDDTLGRDAELAGRVWLSERGDSVSERKCDGHAHQKGRPLCARVDRRDSWHQREDCNSQGKRPTSGGKRGGERQCALQYVGIGRDELGCTLLLVVSLPVGSHLAECVM